MKVIINQIIKYHLLIDYYFILIFVLSDNHWFIITVICTENKKNQKAKLYLIVRSIALRRFGKINFDLFIFISTSHKYLEFKHFRWRGNLFRTVNSPILIRFY